MKTEYLVGGGILGLLGLYVATRGKPTYFTILMENHSAAQVLGAADRPAGMPYLKSLADSYGNAVNYRNNHLNPSLPNYLILTSGQTWGVTDDAYHLIRDGGANLFSQMTAAGIPWRAYAESMDRPCRTSDTRLYASRHNPAVYYESIVRNPAECAKVVDLAALGADLDADTVRYAWITPNMVNDVHDGTLAQGDAWLRMVIPRLMQSAGYRNGGAIFILFDESFTSSDLLAAVVISDRLKTRPLIDTTAYTHKSYLAAMQDLLGLPRLPTTVGVPSMRGMLT